MTVDEDDDEINRSWTNWCGNVTFTPLKFHEPRTESQLQEIVRQAVADRRTVRVVGRGHSFNFMNAAEDGHAVSLMRYSKLLEVDRDNMLVSCQAGISLVQLLERLEEHSMTLSNLPIVAGITLGGALCTSAHGSGIDHGILSGQMVACRLINGRGELVDIDVSGPNAHLLPAVRVSLGVLGILSTVTLRTIPAMKLHVREFPMAFDTCLAGLHKYKTQYEYFKAWWFPHTGFVHAFLIDRKSDLMDHPDTLGLSAANAAYASNPGESPPVTGWVGTKAGNKIVNELFALNAKDTSTIPFVNHALREVLFTPKRCYEDSGSVLTNGHWSQGGNESEGCRFDVLEYTVPAEAVVAALEEYSQILDEQGLFMSFPVDIRFSKRDDDCWLSPAFGFDAAWIGIPAKRPNGVETKHTDEFWEFERIMIQHGGRPHWAKQHSQDSTFFSNSYPHWEDFLAVRALLDPAGVFLNPYLRNILGLSQALPTAPVPTAASKL